VHFLRFIALDAVRGSVDELDRLPTVGFSTQAPRRGRRQLPSPASRTSTRGRRLSRALAKRYWSHRSCPGVPEIWLARKLCRRWKRRASPVVHAGKHSVAAPAVRGGELHPVLLERALLTRHFQARSTWQPDDHVPGRAVVPGVGINDRVP
jgi:hypothetical protein